MVIATKERKKRASFDELLLAGVRAIAQRGIDHVSVSDVAKLSDVSRPTFYTYFGDMSGFFAEIWLRYGRQWLEAQACESQKLEPELDQALLEIFSVARRVPEVFEVLQPDFKEWWSEKTEDNAIESQRLVWDLGFLLGFKLSSRVTKKSKIGLPIRDFIQLPKSVLELPGMENLGEKITAEQYAPLAGLSKEDQTVEAILTHAAIDVIGSSGVAACSMTRIARRARVSTGSVYPRFKSADELIQKSFTTAIQNIVSNNVQMVAQQGIGIDKYAMTINAGFSETRKTWRNFRTEMHIEAAHDSDLASYMESGFEKAAEFLENSFIEFGLEPNRASEVAWFLHSHAIGISIIHSFLPEIELQDNRIMGRWLVQGLLKGQNLG